jgi:hypothetical protein
MSVHFRAFDDRSFIGWLLRPAAKAKQPRMPAAADEQLATAAGAESVGVTDQGPRAITNGHSNLVWRSSPSITHSEVFVGLWEFEGRSNHGARN